MLKIEKNNSLTRKAHARKRNQNTHFMRIEVKQNETERLLVNFGISNCAEIYQDEMHLCDFLKRHIPEMTFCRSDGTSCFASDNTLTRSWAKAFSSTWGICTRRAGKLERAHSRLYRSQILQVNMRWKALAEI